MGAMALVLDELAVVASEKLRAAGWSSVAGDARSCVRPCDTLAKRVPNLGLGVSQIDPGEY